MIQPWFVASLTTEKTLNMSPKVAGPLIVGLAAAGLCCEARHYGYVVDPGLATFVIVSLMGIIGWWLPHAAPDKGPPPAA